MSEADQFSQIQNLDANQKKELMDLVEAQWQILRSSQRNKHQALQEEFRDTAHAAQQQLGEAKDASDNVKKLDEINKEVQSSGYDPRPDQEKMDRLNKSTESILNGYGVIGDTVDGTQYSSDFPEGEVEQSGESTEVVSPVSQEVEQAEQLTERPLFVQPHVEISRVVRGEQSLWKLTISDESNTQLESVSQTFNAEEIAKLLIISQSNENILKGLDQKVRFNKFPTVSFHENVGEKRYTIKNALILAIQNRDFLKYFNQPNAKESQATISTEQPRPVEQTKVESEPKKDDMEVFLFTRQTVAVSENLQANGRVEVVGSPHDTAPSSYGDTEKYQAGTQLEAYRISTDKSEIAVAGMGKDDAVKVGYARNEKGEGMIIAAVADGTTDSTFSRFAARMINEKATTFLEKRLQEVPANVAMQELRQLLLEPSWRRDAYKTMVDALRTGNDKYTTDPVKRARVHEQFVTLAAPEQDERKQSTAVFTIQVMNEETGELNILKLGDPYVVADPIPSENSRNPNNLLDDAGVEPHALRIYPGAHDEQLPIKQIQSKVNKSAAFYSDYMDDSKRASQEIDWNLVQNGSEQEFNAWFANYSERLKNEKLPDDASLVIIRRKGK